MSGMVGGPNIRYKGVVDDAVKPGLNSYYLRIVCKDGTVAWSSPLWVRSLGRVGLETVVPHVES